MGTYVTPKFLFSIWNGDYNPKKQPKIRLFYFFKKTKTYTPCSHLYYKCSHLYYKC